ncbi:MAG: heavy metal-associated domain-containing protein, partial [Solirubrobacteraceae bacterium]|nr:heavy metal-associated domain-containing protein [Solirubrobacteraceae bacterium]
MSSLPVPPRAPQLPVSPAKSDGELHLGTELELAVSGMSCAACAARVERSLARLDGVDANVNAATERAAVRFDPAHTSVQDLIDAVRHAGYGAEHIGSRDEELAEAEAE